MPILVTDILIGAIAIVTLLLAVAALWGLFLRVPSVPTPITVVQTMIDLAQLTGAETIVDLGAGDGRVLIEAKKRYPAIRAVGCELNPTIWLIGKLRALLQHTTIELHLRSILREDLTHADVVFLYLFPELMERLITQFDHELKPGTRIVSYMFRLKDREPVTTKEVRGYWGKATVYVYRW